MSSFIVSDFCRTCNTILPYLTPTMRGKALSVIIKAVCDRYAIEFEITNTFETNLVTFDFGDEKISIFIKGGWASPVKTFDFEQNTYKMLEAAYKVKYDKHQYEELAGLIISSCIGEIVADVEAIENVPGHRVIKCSVDGDVHIISYPVKEGGKYYHFT